MKVLFFTTYYSHYLDQFYQKRPHLVKASYKEQLATIMQDPFGSWGTYVTYFNKIQVESHLVIANCKPLQKAWATENSIPFENDWRFRIPYEQAKRIKPDIFYISSVFEYYDDFLRKIKEFVPNVFGWIACAIPPETKLTNLDLIITSIPYYVDQFRSNGIPSEYLHAAFDTEILKQLNEETQKDIEFSFIGSFTHFHKNRIRVIKKLIDHTPLIIYGSILENIPDERNILSRLFSKSSIKKRHRGEAWGLEMYRILKRSKITFNNHIDISNAYTGNIRMFEATGVGTLLLTDGKKSPLTIFNDNEVVYYESDEEAIEKYQYYIDNEADRNEIALRGQRKTHAEFNYEITSGKLLDYFKKYRQ